MKKVVIILVIVVAVAAGAFALTRKSDNNTATNSSANPTSGDQAQTASPSPSSSQSAAAIITYSDSGFSPSSITVKSGDTVTIKNTSSNGLQLDSDPHPIHTDDTDLNVGTVATGQSQTFTVTKKGTFGYHNHLNPSDKGEIVIQ